MRIENKYYIIMKPGNIDIPIPNNETVFLSNQDDSGFTNDILKANKYVNRKSALIDKNYYDVHTNNGVESDMVVLPMKITYEW